MMRAAGGEGPPQMALLRPARRWRVCRASVVWWWAPDGRREQRVPTDLVDIAEQAVGICAEMGRGADPRYQGLARAR